MEVDAESSAIKRKRSPSSTSQSGSAAPPAKASRTLPSQLSINYLARQSQEDLPLINKDDTLPSLLNLLSSYSNVLDRHESLASNLGARPLGPILIKRFERCFDAPPKVVASHHKGAASNPDDAHQITWLEVIEFARSHPSQFTLSTFSEGKRVCQFYYPQKQLRVQISEEDFLFINSGRCQELIPPLPIWEDEEKEVTTCDVLEAKLKELTITADMVAARTRQLSHRLKGRKAAILERRAEGGSGTPAKASAQLTTTAPPLSSGGGFTAVNVAGSKPSTDAEPALMSNASMRSDLLRHLESLPHNQNQSRPQARQSSITIGPDGVTQSMKASDFTRENGGADSTTSSLSPIPNSAYSTDPLSYYVTDAPTISRQPPSGHRPSSSAGSLNTLAPAPFKHNFSRPLPPALENSQPFRPLCQAHMDSLPRGTRVLPPCDRCRRLRMDCVKNLTSCAGCTRKHARCHWRDVSRDELGALDHLMDTAYPSADASAATTGAGEHTNGYANGEDERQHEDSDDDDSNPLEDLEALGEKAEQEHEAAVERMREDEEGLQHARDLARQGWEESLKGNQIDEGERSVVAPDAEMAAPDEGEDSSASIMQQHAETAVVEDELPTASPVEKDADTVVTDADHSTAFVPLVNGEGSSQSQDKHDEGGDDDDAIEVAGRSSSSSINISTRDEAVENAVRNLNDAVSYGGFRAVNESLNGWRAS